MSYTVQALLSSAKITVSRATRLVAGKMVRFLKAEMKRAGVTTSELAKRLEDHGLQESEASIANKFSRGTIAAALLLAALEALGLEGIKLGDW